MINKLFVILFAVIGFAGIAMICYVLAYAVKLLLMLLLV